MAIWKRNKTPITESEDLKEASRQTQMSITNLMNQPYYQFTSQLTALRGVLGISTTVKQAMLKDPIITQIVNMWISDTLNKDILSGKIFEVEIKDNHSGKTDINKTIKSASSAIDYLLENSNLDEQLVSILYKVIVDGIASVRLGFVDKYEDTKIKLFESNKRTVDKNKDMFTKRDENNNLLLFKEAPTYDDYELDIHKPRSKVDRLSGRFYFEILPQRIVPLKHKGITILYLDLNNQLNVLNPRNITTFVNTRGGTKTLSLKENPEDIDSELYEVPLGKSFIEQAITPWSMYNTAQDSTILALMTRASIYRLFQVDVGAMSVKETEQLLQEFKKRLTTRETIDVRAQHYSSAQTQLPLGDSIVIPTRNGVGTTTVQSIGGDLNIQTEGPMEFFREELLASLGIAKDLVYGSDGGALINTSATRSDIRYLRTVQQFVSIMSLGLEDIFKDYLKMVGFDLSDLSVKVLFKQLNSEEALQKIEYEQTRQEALDRTITSLNNLGITFDNGQYKGLRDELITRYLDESILQIIRKDEETKPSEPITDDTGDTEDDDSNLESMPPMSDFGPSSDVGLPGEGEPTEEPPTDVSPEDTELPEVEPNDNINVNEEPPYSLG